MPDERILRFVEEMRGRVANTQQLKPIDKLKAKEDSLRTLYNIKRYQDMLNPSPEPETEPTVKDSLNSVKDYMNLRTQLAKLKQKEGLPLDHRDSSYLDLKPPKRETADERDQKLAKILEQRIKAKQLAEEDASEDLARLKNISDKSYLRLAKEEATSLKIAFDKKYPELNQAFIYMKVGDAIKEKYGEDVARKLGLLKSVPLGKEG